MVIVVSETPSLSTDQIAAFVELSRHGSIRAAAEVLLITEQGARNRLLALESRLGVELYRKVRGMRRATPLTAEGRQFLPHAIAFLDRASQLGQLFNAADQQHEINVVASQYLTTYVLIGAVRRFHKAHPNIRVRLSIRTEAEVEQALLEEPDMVIGVAAPYETSPELDYQHLFSMNWSVITPRRHRLSSHKQLRLAHLIDQPLILYERGSTGRQHIMDAFRERGLSPRVEMEATNTDIIVRMVEAGLGISIVPLLPSGIVTQRRPVGIRSLGRQVREIQSGILVRKAERLSDAAAAFVQFVKGHVDESALQRVSSTE